MKSADKPTWGGLVEADGKLTKKEISKSENPAHLRYLIEPYVKEKGIDTSKEYSVDIDKAVQSFRDSLGEQISNSASKAESAPNPNELPAPQSKGGVEPAGP